MRASLATLLLLLLLVPAPGFADSTPMFSAGIFRQEVIPVRMATLRGVQLASESAPRLPSDVLRFTRTHRVEMQARDRLLASLLATTDDPAFRARIHDSVASGEVWREFDRILSFVGYSSRNLADVTTAYYVIAWEVVSGAHAIDYLRGVRIVRDAVAEALLADPDVAALPDPEKHEAAVVMAYMAIVAGHRMRELRDAGDLAGLKWLREQVRRSVLVGQGVDLAALRLTNLGFVVD